MNRTPKCGACRDGLHRYCLGFERGFCECVDGMCYVKSPKAEDTPEVKP